MDWKQAELLCSEGAGSVQLERRRLREILSTSTETWMGDWRKQARLCSVVPSDKARGSRHKQKYREFHLNIKTNTFTLKAVKHWSRLCRGCGVSLLLWMLDQAGLGAALSNLLQQTLLWGAEVGLHNPTGLFRPQLFKFWFGFYRLHIFIHTQKKKSNTNIHLVKKQELLDCFIMTLLAFLM